MSLQPNDNQDNNNTQVEFQKPNPTLDTQSTDFTVDSNALLVPVRQVEEQNMTHNTEQDPHYQIQGSSTLSTTNTTIPQLRIQKPTSKNYASPPPPESDTYISSSMSQQSNSFNNFINGLIHNTRPRFTFQSPSTPEMQSVTTHPYTQAQNTSDPNTPTSLNINKIHTNPPPNIVISRTLFNLCWSLIKVLSDDSC